MKSDNAQNAPCTANTHYVSRACYFLISGGVINPCYMDEEGGKKGIPEQLNELETWKSQDFWNLTHDILLEFVGPGSFRAKEETQKGQRNFWLCYFCAARSWQVTQPSEPCFPSVR